MYIILVLSFLFPFCLQAGAAHLCHSRSSNNQCQPFSTTFPSSSVSSTRFNPPSPAPFVAISPQGSYRTTQGGLELLMQRPEGSIQSKDGVNDKAAEGATINSTFTILYGKVSFEVIAPVIPGVVTAAILIAKERDEIDIELLGGDAKHWQTNVFVPSPKDHLPLYGVFSSIERVPGSAASISQSHTYTMDWSKERIEWAVDGTTVRTLNKADTWKNGVSRYPSRPAHIQIGIWDASNPAGTSEWAKGPINWQSAPRTIKAIFKRVNVECPE